MKKIGIIISVFACLLVGGTTSFASNGNNATQEMMREIQLYDLQASLLNVNALNVINWKVGETANYKITSSWGELGALKKWLDREDGNAVWMISDVSGMMTQKIEAKIDRATGQIVDYIENGVRKTPPANDLEIISQDEQEITVPAGTFTTIHVVAKPKDQQQVQEIELWVNPRDIVMEGMAQMKLKTSMMPVTIKLINFSRP